MASPSLSTSPDRGSDPTDITRAELELEAAIRRGDIDAAKALMWEIGAMVTRAAHLAERRKAGLCSGEARRALSDKKRRRWMDIAAPYRLRHPDHSTADVARFVASEVERLNLDCRAALDTIRKALAGTAKKVGIEHCSRPCAPNAGPACCEQSTPEAR